MRTLPVVIACFVSIVCVVFPLAAMAAEPEAEDYFEASVRPVVVEFCGACHADDGDNRNHFASAQSAADMQRARSLWASIAVQLRNRTMPPVDEAQPTEADRLRIASWIENTLRSTACSGGQFAGWVPARRLNRVEYDNTIRDLVGVELGFAKTLPVDSGGGEGFDNNGETLFLPPLLLERYLEAAQQVVDAAIITPPLELLFTADDFLPKREPKEESIRMIPAGENVSVLVPIAVESDFRIAVGAYADAAQVDVVIRVDGIDAETLTFREYANEESAHQEETQLRLTRGLHSLSIQAPEERPLRAIRLRVSEISPEATASRIAIHRRLLGTAPGDVPVESRAAAAKLIRRFASNAFRRPVSTAEIERFLQLYDRAAKRGDAYEARIKLALKAVLVSPEFLFRMESPVKLTERERAGDVNQERESAVIAERATTVRRAATIEPLSDHELATRLSYFLWSTMPDAELRLLARQGQLQNEETLRQQVERMLDDPKAYELFSTFIGQWLGTRDVGGSVAPTDNSIQHFYTPDVATDMRTEAVLLYQGIVRENRSLLELIDSDYQYMTGRLAKFYELDVAQELVKDEFQRVQLPDRRRGGVLGLGAVLALTSHTSAKETSPVLRGAWVLDTLLGTPVPSPPPDIPALDPAAARKQKLSLRELLQVHRASDTCAACHDLIDPIGFGLENFDFLGRWRDEIAGKAIDTAGALPSGETFDGPMELKRILLARKREFLRQITRKMLGYAIGRSLQDEDQCTIETLVDALETHDYSARTLVHGVVLSSQFRFKQSAP